MRYLGLFFGAVFLFVLAIQHDPFFWDTVQLASKHAHFFYENDLRWAPLPAGIDSGHPPFLGYYLAVVWSFFGKTLPASHWAMLPFLLAVVWLLYRLGLRLGGQRWVWWLLPLVMLDPVVAGQSALVSPDIILLAWFLLTVEGILGKNKLWIALGVAGLCTVSTRGMMTAAALAVWSSWELAQTLRILSPWQVWIKRWLPFLPGFALAGGFLWWHQQATGWTGYHADSPWATAFERSHGAGLLKNTAVIAWRWLDFGRVVEWSVLGWWMLRQRSQLLARMGGAQGRLLICLIVFLTPTALLYANLSAHRYFLPLFVGLHLFLFQKITSEWVHPATPPRSILNSRFSILNSQFSLPALLLAALILAMASGNLWRYPRGISMDWDSTLAHLPYHALRAKAIDFLEEQKIDFQSVGSAFPNLNSGENLLLNGDARRFAEKDFAKNQYIFCSNIFNDFDTPDYQVLEQDWSLLRRWEHPNGVWIEIYQRK